MASVLVALTACQKVELSEPSVENEQSEQTSESVKTKKFTFTMKGDFSNEWKPVTRAYLSADGKDLTDVWVLDYDADGNLLQQLHQDDNTAEDFGKPVMQLAYGVHRIYFVASRGVNPVLSTDTHTLTFDNVRDTFWKRYDVTVVATSNGNRAVTLDRIVTKLRLTFTDEMPNNAASIIITPHTWYYGFDYTTGQPANAQTDKSSTIDIPSTSIGQTGVQASLFSFSTADEWTTDVAISSQSATGSVLGSATIASAPFQANRVSDYAGPLFSSGGSMTLSLNGEWTDSHEGTW